jgi:hypothetical protein
VTPVALGVVASGGADQHENEQQTDHKPKTEHASPTHPHARKTPAVSRELRALGYAADEIELSARLGLRCDLPDTSGNNSNVSEDAASFWSGSRVLPGGAGVIDA